MAVRCAACHGASLAMSPLRTGSGPWRTSWQPLVEGGAEGWSATRQGPLAPPDVAAAHLRLSWTNDASCRSGDAAHE
jgi:hypothetical protein